MIASLSRTALLGAGLLIAGTIALYKSDFAFAQSGTPRATATSPVDCAHFLPYSDDPHHIWNRVHRRLMERHDRYGNVYGCDDVDPLLWQNTDLLLRGSAYRETVILLDEFTRTHAERLIREPLARAIFQRDLWAVFEWLAGPLRGHEKQRAELERRLATIIKALALTPSEIQHLPDVYAALAGSVTSDDFLFPDPAGSWILVARDDGTPIAPIHSFRFSHSLFLVYLRLPTDGPRPSAYLEALRTFSRKNPEGACFPPDPPCSPPQFPVGTELALFRRALLIDSSGHPQVSPITESIQLRRYREIPQQYTIDWAGVMQRSAEFQLTRRPLQRGNVALRRVSEDEYQFPVFVSHGFDLEGPTLTLRSCHSCHQGIGVFSFTSYSRVQFENKHTFILVHEASEPEESAAALAFLQGRESWKSLQHLMR